MLGCAFTRIILPSTLISQVPSLFERSKSPYVFGGEQSLSTSCFRRSICCFASCSALTSFSFWRSAS